MFELIIKEVGNRFNLGEKALPLVQALVATMTNQDSGGLAGFVEQLKAKGLGSLLDSWTTGSAPLAINHAQIEEILGGNGGLLDLLSQKLGLDKGSSLLGLAYLLPELFKKLMPGGQIDRTLSSAASQFAGASAATESNLGGIAAAATAGLAGIAAATTAGSPASALVEKSTLSVEDVVKGVNDRFSLGAKSTPLVQTVLAAMTNSATGGVSGFAQIFKNCGLGNLVDSWMNSNSPLIINHMQIEDALGGKGGLLEAIIQKVGLDKGASLLGLSYLLPTLFKKLAPGGKVESVLPEDVKSFAEKGMALLSAPSAAAPTPVMAPTPVVAPVAAAAATVTSLQKETAPEVPKPQPTPAPTPIPARPTVSDDDEESDDGIMKFLPWLLPIALGLWLLKSCGDTAEVSKTTPAVESNVTLPTGSPDASSGMATPEPTPAVSSPDATAVPQADPAAAASGAATEPVTTTPEPMTTTTPAPVTPEPTAMPETTPAPTPEVTAAPSSTPEASSAAPGVIADAPSAKLYFEVAKTKLPADTAEKLAPVVEYAKANKSAKVFVSGFHDPTGNISQNLSLAKNRAKQVYARLAALGISKKAIVMEKPASSEGTGDNNEARRVEVTVRQ